MAISTEEVARRYLNVTAGQVIAVPFPAFEASTVYVYYGIGAVQAVQNTDFTVALAEDFSTFSVTVLQPLVTKIGLLTAADPDEENAITVRRILVIDTDATSQAARSSVFVADEFDRQTMKDQQLKDEIGRAIRLRPTQVAPYPNLFLDEIPDDLTDEPTIAFKEDGTGLKVGPTTAAISGAQAAATTAVAAAALAVAAAQGITNARLEYPNTAALVAGDEESRGEGMLWRVRNWLVREAAPAATDHDLVNAAGVKFYVEPYAGLLTVSQWGGAESEDVWAEVQAALDRSMYGNGNNALIVGAPVVIDFKDVEMSDTLQIGYGTDFRNGHVRGLGPRYFQGAAFSGTLLRSQVYDKPCVDFEGSRGSSLRDISVEDPSYATIYAWMLGTPNTRLKQDIANWYAELASASFAGQNDRAPPCNIAIGAYAGSAPTPAYPNQTFPAFLGSPAQYGKSPPSDDLLDTVSLYGGLNGVVIGPNSNNNHDFMKLRDVDFFYMVIGLSVGPNQARITELTNGNFARVHTCVTNRLHGTKQGRFDSTAMHMHGGGFVGQIFDLGDASTGGTLTIQSAYFEALGKLGTITTTVSAARPNVVFNAGQFAFINADDEYVVPKLIDGTWRDLVVFNGTNLRTRSAVFLGSSEVVINDAAIITDVPGKAYECIALNGMSGGFVMNDIDQKPFNAYMRVWDSASPGSTPAQVRTDQNFQYTSRDYGIPYNCVTGRCEQGGHFFNKALPRATNPNSTISAVSRTDRAVTLTCTNANNADVDRRYRRATLPGCVWVDNVSGTILFVRSTNQTTGEMVLEMQNNYYFDGANYQILDSSYDPLTADYDCYNTLVYAPERALYGTITAGSNVITNVQDFLGGALTAFGGLQVGDRYADELYDRPGFTGTNNCGITAIDTGARTITLQGNFGYSAQNVPLNFWWRQPPANEASR